MAKKPRIRMRVTECLARYDKRHPEAKKRTMVWLAGKLGVDEATVRYWNQGRSTPRLPRLLQVAKILDMHSLKHFFEEEDW